LADRVVLKDKFRAVFTQLNPIARSQIAASLQAFPVDVSAVGAIEVANFPDTSIYRADCGMTPGHHPVLIRVQNDFAAEVSPDNNFTRRCQFVAQLRFP
jgi:hypothetical protein